MNKLRSEKDNSELVLSIIYKEFESMCKTNGLNCTYYYLNIGSKRWRDEGGPLLYLL